MDERSINEVSKNNPKHRPIQRLLRRKGSQDYFTGIGWTKQIEQARAFQDSLEAAQTCAHCGLSEVEMVLRIEGGTGDLYCTSFR
jgi:hypothetical protein